MVVNFLIMMAIYMLCRWFFYYVNRSSFQDVTFGELMTMSLGGLRFDLSALCYLNALCALLQFLPIKARHTVKYQRVVKILFLVINAIGIAVNVADVVYYEFGGRRTTFTIFSEFGGEGNLGKVFLDSMTGHWMAWLFGVLMIAAAIFADDFPPSKKYYMWHGIAFLVAAILTLGGLRGGLTWKMHPLRQDSAELYCQKPNQTAIVLNTPFTLLTTMHKGSYKNPHFFDDNQLDAIFNPIRNTQVDGGEMKKYNVMVFLLESFSMEYTGFYNRDRDGGKYQGYTPFLDSLLSQSYSFRYSFANGTRSVDCMPASFAGIPRYIDPYCYYAYSNNTLQGLPQMLRDEGYTTAFFHGAPNTTLGFQSFTNVIGFESCDGVSVVGLTLGHTEGPSDCCGAVLNFESCNSVSVEGCRLYGCGTLGINASYGRDLKVKDCEIYDCSIGGAVLYTVYGATFENCRIHDVPSPALCFYNCSNVLWNGTTVDDAHYDVNDAGELVPVNLG